MSDSIIKTTQVGLVMKGNINPSPFVDDIIHNIEQRIEGKKGMEVVGMEYDTHIEIHLQETVEK